MVDNNIQDRRIRKTRNALKTSLINLMKEKPLNKISVKELTEACDLNRATFYLHYKDVFDMMEQLEEEFFADVQMILEKHSPTDNSTFKAMLADVFLYIADEENLAFTQLIVGKYANSTFIVKFAELFKKKYYFDWENIPASMQKTGSFIFSYVMSGAIGLIQTWVQDIKQLSAIEAAYLTSELCLSGMAMLIGNKKF